MLKYLAPLGLSFADLFFKERIDGNYDKDEHIPALLPGIEYRKLHNSGFAMEKMADEPEKVKWVGAAVTAFCGLGWLLALGKKGHRVEKLAWTLSLAGGLSNTIDRFRKGYVVDYIQSKKGPEKFRKIVFNLGDVMIAAGSVLLALIAVVRSLRDR